MVKEYSFLINNKLHIEVIGKIIWPMVKVYYHMMVVINIKDFLKIIKKMDLEHIKNKKMDKLLNIMKVIGKMIKKMAEAFINIIMEIYMKEIGLMIKDVNMEDMNSKMEINMMVNGKKILFMAKVF